MRPSEPSRFSEMLLRIKRWLRREPKSPEDPYACDGAEEASASAPPCVRRCRTPREVTCFGEWPARPAGGGTQGRRIEFPNAHRLQ
jgi:hypothetical protein